MLLCTGHARGQDASVLMWLLHQIDLDTIETSNLNRQFLFRRAHVSQSKAQVAADVVKTFAPEANIKAYQVCGGSGSCRALPTCTARCFSSAAW